MNQENTLDLDEGDRNQRFSQYFDFQSILGNGAFGLVVAAKDKKTGEHVAVKIAKKNLMDQSYQSLQRESTILSQFNHPNIVRFKKTLETEKRLFLVMECLEGGQLKNKMEDVFRQGKKFTENEASIIIKTIAEGLAYLHMNDTIHRDLKPDNLLLKDSNDLGSVKIADFGLAAQYDLKTNLIMSFSEKWGTKIYMAPEMFGNSEYGKPIDIWSLGIIMYQLLNDGRHPFFDPKKDSVETFHKNITTQFVPPDHLSGLAQQLLTSMLQIEPSKRYTAASIVSHPWITRNFNDKLPLTINEKLEAYNHQNTLIRIIKALMFTNLIKKQQNKQGFLKRLNSYSQTRKARSNSVVSIESIPEYQESIPKPMILVSNSNSPTHNNGNDERPSYNSIANGQSRSTIDMSRFIDLNPNNEPQTNSSMFPQLLKLNLAAKDSTISTVNKDILDSQSARGMARRSRGTSVDYGETIRRNRATNITATLLAIQNLGNNQNQALRETHVKLSLTPIPVEDDGKPNASFKVEEKTTRSRSQTYSYRAGPSASPSPDKKSQRNMESFSPVKARPINSNAPDTSPSKYNKINLYSENFPPKQLVLIKHQAAPSTHLTARNSNSLSPVKPGANKKTFSDFDNGLLKALSNINSTIKAIDPTAVYSTNPRDYKTSLSGIEESKHPRSKNSSFVYVTGSASSRVDNSTHRAQPLTLPRINQHKNQS